MRDELRPDQLEIVEAALAWIRRARAGGASRQAHIVLPPRTGKTVIAAHIAARSGLNTVFVVPTRVLVHQTRVELRRHAPELAVGAWYGELKAPVARGVNLTTHACLRRGGWGEELSRSELVFIDEAHHVLSGGAAANLRRAFDASSLQIALTATPDYDTARSVLRWFPERIAHVELPDALRRGLVAPAVVHVGEVDVDGSRVELTAGEYRPDQLSRLLAGGPFLHAALTWRYQKEHRDIPCLMVCVTRAQADDLAAYLRARRPPDRPPPALILGETPGEERERLLRAFEAGEIDTICQVGVLIEGWTSARCKLLIDLAPGRSRVRATQKYFRVLTRSGDAIARIIVLLPRALPEPPVLPMDLLLPAGEVYTPGRVIGRGQRREVEGGPTPVNDVRLVQRVVVSTEFGLPRLDPTRADDVRAVLASCEALCAARVLSRGQFERLYFKHPLFGGTGRTLLRWLAVPWGAASFWTWLARVWSERAADLLLGGVAEAPSEAEVTEADELVSTLDPEAVLLQRERVVSMMHALDRLPPKQRVSLRLWLGLDPDVNMAGEPMAPLKLSDAQLQRHTRYAIFLLRQEQYKVEDSVPPSRGRDEAALEALATLGLHNPLIIRARRALERGDPRLARLTLGRLRESDAPLVRAMLAEAALQLGDPVDPLLAELASFGWLQAHWVVPLAWALVDHGRSSDALPFMLRCSAEPAWEAAQLYVVLGHEDIAAQLMQRAQPPDLPSAWHRFLLRHRSGAPFVRDLLSALYRDMAEHGRLCGPWDPRYLARARGLWADSPGARRDLSRWTRSPAVRAWLQALRERRGDGRDMAVPWAQAEDLARRVAAGG